MIEESEASEQQEANEEAEGLPWWTDEEAEYAAEQFSCLKTSPYDPEAKTYRDIRWLYFDPYVLEKYRHNDLCMIDSDRISFMQSTYDKKVAVSTVNFFIRDFGSNQPTNKVLVPEKLKPGMPDPKTKAKTEGPLLIWQPRPILMVQAQEYVHVPPRQKQHWQQYRIYERDIIQLSSKNK
jgi:hypothetical protein